MGAKGVEIKELLNMLSDSDVLRQAGESRDEPVNVQIDTECST